MHFGFTEDQQMVRDTAEAVAADLFDATTIRRAIDEAEEVGAAAKTRAERWGDVAELGWAGILVPEEMGGSGGTLIDACILAEVLSGALAPIPFVGTAIGVGSLLVAADDAEAAGELAQGRPMSLLVDDDLAWPATNPVLALDWLEGALGVLPAGDSVVRSPIDPVGYQMVDPLHPLAIVEGIQAPGPLDEQFRRARAALQVGTAAALMGHAAAALDEAVEYAKEREQYGRPIAEFQAIQHICADMFVDVEASRSMVYGAAWTVENGTLEEAERLARAATAWCGPASIRVCESGIQVLGGIGVTWEHDAPFRLRSVQLLNRAITGPDVAAEAYAHAATHQKDA